MCGLSLTACGGLDTQQISTKILKEINQQGGLTLKAVKCPQDVSAKVGETFNCRGELDAKKSFSIKVTLKDSQGDVAWEVPNSKTLLNLRNLESQFKDALQAAGTEAEVKCGIAAYRLNVPGESFECATVKQGKQGTILVRLDPQGNVTWNEVIDVPVAKVPATTQQQTTQQNAASQLANSAASTPTTGQVNQPAASTPAAPGAASPQPTQIVDPGSSLPDITDD